MRTPHFKIIEHANKTDACSEQVQMFSQVQKYLLLGGACAVGAVSLYWGVSGQFAEPSPIVYFGLEILSAGIFLVIGIWILRRGSKSSIETIMRLFFALGFGLALIACLLFGLRPSEYSSVFYTLIAGFISTQIAVVCSLLIGRKRRKAIQGAISKG